MSGERPGRYSTAPAITWVKDSGQTIVVNAATGEGWRLSGLEAAVWDLLALGYPVQRVLGFLRVMAEVAEEEGGEAEARGDAHAERILRQAVEAWAEAGILVVGEGGGGG